MKKHIFTILLAFIFAIEAVALLVFAAQDTAFLQDAVAVNELLHLVQTDWNTMGNHQNLTDFDYVVLDMDQNILYKTRPGLSESINAAVIHRDTILDIETDGGPAGKIIIYNPGIQIMHSQKKMIIIFLSASMLVQFVVCAGYFIYLNHAVIKPFRKLKNFAERVAGGNLDIPLEMDRQNLFGAFTESFDLMRTELKKARIAEAEANAGKKELVAKLSHDIKTPVASIKAVSEVGAALTEDDKTRENYTQIIRKADQINTLITNLFTATLEELRQLPVTPSALESRALKEILENADYLHHADIPDIPDCLLYADRLRLQQVFDNIFTNSYKYANTGIDVSILQGSNSLTIITEDYGGGVSPEELPLLKEKFRRGSNTEGTEGAGLGLYISDFFLKEMKGELVIENGRTGLKVKVIIHYYPYLSAVDI